MFYNEKLFNLSLRQRLLISAFFVLIFFLWITSYTLQNAYEKGVRQSHKNALTGYLYALLAATNVDDDANLNVEENLLGHKFNLPSSGLYAIIYDKLTDEIVWSSLSTLGVDTPEILEIDTGLMLFKTAENIKKKSFFMLTFGVTWQLKDEFREYVFSIVEDYSQYDSIIKAYKKTLWTWLIILATLLLMIQAIVLHWVLKPLRTVATEINEIEEGKRDALKGHYPYELNRLTSNINALISNERQHLIRYRHTLSDLAHSLKTPLAVLRNYFYDETHQSETHQNNENSFDTPSKAVKNAQIAQEQVDRMLDIVDYQLQRAAVSGKQTFSSPVYVKKLVERIIYALERAYLEKNIQYEIDISDDVVFYGDKGDFMEIIGNICDNAFKWGDQKVRVSAQNSSSFDKGSKIHNFIIQVDDDGKGFADKVAKDILQRGVRGDMTEGPPGQGIGLSVVKDIVDSYRGEIVFSENEWRGASIRLMFVTS